MASWNWRWSLRRCRMWPTQAAGCALVDEESMDLWTNIHNELWIWSWSWGAAISMQSPLRNYLMLVILQVPWRVQNIGNFSLLNNKIEKTSIWNKHVNTKRKLTRINDDKKGLRCYLVQNGFAPKSRNHVDTKNDCSAKYIWKRSPQSEWDDQQIMTSSHLWQNKGPKAICDGHVWNKPRRSR